VEHEFQTELQQYSEERFIVQKGTDFIQIFTLYFKYTPCRLYLTKLHKTIFKVHPSTKKGYSMVATARHLHAMKPQFHKNWPIIRPSVPKRLINCKGEAWKFCIEGRNAMLSGR
jgi:hypothetical protein